MVDGRSGMSMACLGAKHGSVVYGDEAGPVRTAPSGKAGSRRWRTTAFDVGGPTSSPPGK